MNLSRFSSDNFNQAEIPASRKQSQCSGVIRVNETSFCLKKCRLLYVKALSRSFYSLMYNVNKTNMPVEVRSVPEKNK